MKNQELDIHFGWAFDLPSLPYNAIVGIALNDEFEVSVGVHGFQDYYLVNGETGNLVTIKINPQANIRPRVTGGLTTRPLETLVLSVQNREAFVSAVQGRLQ
jgi:hypothetical protein